MMILIIDFSFDKSAHFLQSIKLKLTGETLFESPLHQLPHLLELLSAKSLNTYVIRFDKNEFDRFDIEIHTEYPPVREGIILVDVARKIQRLLHYYYERNESFFLRAIPYNRFVSFFKQYQAPYSSWNDEELYQLSPQWEQLAEAYALLSEPHDLLEKDFFYNKLKEKNMIYRRPPMGCKHCRFDEIEFKKSQMILQNDAFSIVFNYRPQGDTRFHLMISSLQHEADVSTATPNHLFELESLLRTVYDVAAQIQCDEKIVIYMQKHACMGMTIPHFHIQALLTPKIDLFKHHILQEIRFIITSILNPQHKNPFVKPPLSYEFMQHEKKTIVIYSI